MQISIRSVVLSFGFLQQYIVHGVAEFRDPFLSGWGPVANRCLGRNPQGSGAFRLGLAPVVIILPRINPHDGGGSLINSMGLSTRRWANAEYLSDKPRGTFLLPALYISGS